MTREFNLIVDVGNSTTVYALFEKDIYVSSVTFSTYEQDKKVFKKEFSKFFEQFNEINYKIVNGMIFSVVPLYNDDVKSICKKFFKIKPSVFDWEKYELINKDPRITDKIGADLIADIKAAEMFYGHPSLVIDLGTVNKMLLIDKEGVFVSASFAPGMESQLKLMTKNTALLPNVKLSKEVKKEGGLNTAESMQHGVYWSTVGYIEHEQKAQKEILNHPINVILTGGNSALINDNIEDKIYDPLLTLKGMNILFMESKK